jgi:GNAT superfamily N-acetyltransferase
MIEIRAATHNDVESVVELNGQFWNEHYYSEYGEYDAAKTRIMLHGMVDGPASVLIVAEDAGSIVGYIAFIVAQIPWGNVSSAVESLRWVLPEYRDRGVGTDLLDAGLEWAEIMGCDVLEAHDESGRRIHKCLCHGDTLSRPSSAVASAS